ncbi:MAG TPA: PDZ domain-containing protein [Thermoanaerobaculia bacterium]|nr:PDZ domain-containing protein [Thermoanaerobaculia bacterium]
MNRTTLAASLALTLCAGGLDGAAMPEPISYTVRFPAPQTHYAEIEALVPTEGRPEIELMMAVWTPGSYLVREFARNVEAFAALDEAGQPLPVEKTVKNRWRIETRGASRVTVRYKVYSREMSVRTNFVDSSFALVNGASTFLTLADGAERPHDVRVELPPDWKVAVSPLQEAPGGGETRFRAPSFDALVDSPLYAGNAKVYRFEVEGKPCFLVNEGEGSVWDGPRSAADAEKIVRAQARFWGVAPFQRYVFFNLITEAGGGLEHRDSSVLMTNRWRTRTHEGYLDWLGLVSHELFHAWNGKRLRPVELGPFDYESEVYTRNLWVVEGFTSYYDDLILHRTGLLTRKEYLKRLSKTIEGVQTSPSRLVQPLDQASFDAWIKYYRRDENAANTATSYYSKGALVALLLDAKIRRATGGARSLDDALRLAFERFSGDRGFTTGDLYRTFEEVAGTDLSPWIERVTETTAELDYGEALEWYGLRFAEDDKSKVEKELEPQELPAAWLGADTEVEEGRLTVTVIKRGTPAAEAGLNVGDEILAIGDYRIPPEGLDDRLKAYRPGEKATLLVARRDRLVQLPVTFGEKPKNLWKLEPIPTATPEQQARLTAWLSGENVPAGKEKKAEAAVSLP